YFFESLKRISEKEGQAIPTWMSSHPDPGDREDRILSLAARYEQQYPMDRLEQRDLYNALEGVIMGENPRNGFVENGVFYHPELRFQFPVPRSFRVANQASQVVMVEEQGRAAAVFTIAGQSSPQTAAQEFASQQGLQVVNSGSASSNGLPAYYVVADAQTEQGQVLRILAYYVQHADNVYGFTAYSLREQFSAFEQEFLRSMRGFAGVTDQRILNVEPVRLRIESARRSGSFQSFVPSPLPGDLDPQDIAIINQVTLDAPVPAGAFLKLPAR
ncbi:MAG: peptidase M48, partial [Rhodothermales bacterium]